MPQTEIDTSREQRIAAEVIPYAKTDEDQENVWYYYLEDKLNFPFKAKWKSEGRRSSPTEGAAVEVLGMASENDCTEDMFVEVLYQKEVFSVSLTDLEIVAADSATQEAIADWNYWMSRGYQL